MSNHNGYTQAFFSGLRNCKLAGVIALLMHFSPVPVFAGEIDYCGGDCSFCRAQDYRTNCSVEHPVAEVKEQNFGWNTFNYVPVQTCVVTACQSCAAGEKYWKGSCYDQCPLGTRPDASGKQCEPAIVPDNPQTCHPISLDTGNKHLVENDYSHPYGLSFSRYFNYYANSPESRLDYNDQWSMDFHQKLKLSHNYISSSTVKDFTNVSFGDKGLLKHSFRINNATGVVTKDNRYSQLNLTVITNTVSGPSIYTLSYPDGSRYTYNGNGNISSITQPDGVKVTVSNAYTNAVLSKKTVRNVYGQTLIFNYTNSQHFTMTDPDGNVYRYDFDNPDNVAPRLIVTLPDATVIKYTHQNKKASMCSGSVCASTGSLASDGALTSIDYNGVRYLTYRYGTGGRAIHSHIGTANAESKDIVYDLSNEKTIKTTVTNAFNKKATLHFYNDGGNYSLLGAIVNEASVNCVASNSGYYYDQSGFRKLVLDKNKNYTETLRDHRGLVFIERSGLRVISHLNPKATETADSRKIVTSWHATLELPLTRTYYGWNGSAYDTYKKEVATYTANNRLATFTVTDLTTITEPYPTNGRTRSWSYSYTYYDAAKSKLLQKTVDGPRTDVNDITIYNYDTFGNVSSIVNALGHVTTFSNFNGRGLPRNIVDANNNLVEITYTVRGWLDTLTLNGAMTANYDYYANGLLQKVTLEDGSWLSYTYNTARHLTGIKNNLGETITYTPSALDGKWKQEVVKDGSANIVLQRQRVFDELGRVMMLQGQNGQLWQYGYDNNDNVKTENDALEQLTSYSYDAQDRMIESVDPEQNAKTDPSDKHAIAFTYDGQGNLNSVTDPRGNTTSYRYDGFGELIQQSSPDSGITLFTYDEAGNLAGKTDARSISVAYQYDALDRLVAIEYLGKAEEAVTLSYDDTVNGNHGIGQLTQYSANNLQTTLFYNDRGLASNRDCVFVMLCYTTEYHRNGQGQLDEIVYPSGNKVLYGYNGIGQVSSVKWQAAGQALSQAVDIANHVLYRPFTHSIQQFQSGIGVQNQFSYDADGRLQGIVATGNSGSLYSKTYQFTPVNAISNIDDALQAEKNRSYDYDKNSRLITENKGTDEDRQSTVYTYDEVGNRTQQLQTSATGNTLLSETLSYAANSNRLITRDDSVSGNAIVYEYDANGNMTSVINSHSGAVNYDYNAAGRMQLSNLQAGDIIQYTLNAIGQRQIKMANGDASQSTWYSYSMQGQLLAEHNLETQQLQAEYIYLNGLPLAYVVNRNGSPAIYHVINDHLATPQILLDENQDIVWQADYDAFGKISLPIEQVTFNLRFPGQYYDKETGLHYNYYRDYDSSLGRYVQSDPIGLAGGINTYGYVGGNPVSYVDPYGLAMCWISLSRGWMKCVPETSNNDSILISIASGNNGGGKKCRNNVDCTAKKGRGPIPLGCWKWTDEKTSKKNGRALIPCSGTDTNKIENRTLIRSHSCPNPFGPGTGGADGKTFCSEGCVTGTEDSIKKLNKLIDSESENTLYVYP